MSTRVRSTQRNDQPTQQTARRTARRKAHSSAVTPAGTQLAVPLDDGTINTPGSATTLALIQALIPLGLRAVEEALQAEVTALAGARYSHDDGHPDVVRWGRQAGSIDLADQKLPLSVPRVRDRAAGREVPLAAYQQLQTPRAADVGLFRRVLGGISCREYEAAAGTRGIRAREVERIATLYPGER